MYRTKIEYVSLFDGLTQIYPLLIRGETIGYTQKGNNIRLYRIGNPQGGKVLLDGQVHGCSFVSSEMLLKYAHWLLKSEAPDAKRILERNCTLIIPVLNMDNYGRKNDGLKSGTTPDWVNGVDLNRNFTYNWSSAGSSDPTHTEYRGPSPASEFETQALRRVFETEKPAFYINHHNWGGPWLGVRCQTQAQRDKAAEIKTKYQQLSSDMGVEPYSLSIGGLAAGQATSDAAVMGINSYLWELLREGTHNPTNFPSLAEIDSYWFPRWLPLIITVSQNCEVTIAKRYVFKQWQDGDTNPTKTINV